MHLPPLPSSLYVSDLIATICSSYIALTIVKMALLLGPTEYFVLMSLVFMTMSATFG